MTKQERIDKLETELKEAYSEIARLKELADKGFLASDEYTRMKEEIKGLKLMESLSEHHIETEIKGDLSLIENVKKIRDDNIALCAEHGAEYWEGITEIVRWGNKDIHTLEKEILNLKAKVKAKEFIINHLKDVLCGKDPTAPKEKKPGRKPISEAQKKRIIKYREDGYTLKEIVSMEGVSIGAVSNICRGIKAK